MIAASGFYSEFAGTAPEITYYYTICSSSDYYWREDLTPGREELLRRWWKYLESILQKPNLVILISRILPVRQPERIRIHHERQYPRVVKYRNNRNP